MARFSNAPSMAAARAGLALFLLALPGLAVGQSPTLVPATLRSVSPAGVSRGEVVNFTLDGLNIGGATTVKFDDPAITGTASPGGSVNQLRVRAEIGSSARLGLHNVSLETPLGVTGGVSFVVGGWPVIPESESSTPQQITTPATVSGRLDVVGDTDAYLFRAEAGQEFVAEVFASRIRSRLAGLLTVSDPDGRLIQRAQGRDGQVDPLLTFKAPRAGSYRLTVRDLENAGGGDVTYRLNVTTQPYTTHAFPLGFRKGQAEVRLYGPGLGTDGTTVVVESQATGRGASAQVRDTPAGSLLAPVTLRVGAEPEVMETPGLPEGPAAAQPVTLPVTINGRIHAERGPDHDHYRFHARKGEELSIEVDARRLGSPLDSFVEVLDARGRPVERATLRGVAETVLTLADRDSATTGLRLLNWSDFAVRDLCYLRGEVAQIAALPRGPDDDVRFRSLRGVRRGLLDTTPTGHAVNTPVYKVTVHPPGTQLPPNGLPLIRLYYRNDDGGPLYGKDSYLTFTAPEDGDYLVRIGDVRGESGPDYGYRLTVRPRTPDFRATLAVEQPGIPAGASVPIEVSLDRFEGFEAPVEVRLEGLPAGFRATATTVEAGEATATLLLSALPGAATAAAPQLTLVATALTGGREVRHATPVAGGRCRLTVLPGADLTVTTASDKLQLQPGGQGWIEARITRRNGFAGRVPIEVRNLPFGVRVLDVGLNGVLITESETSRRFAVVCEPWVKPMRWPIYCTVRTETGSAAPTEVSAEPITLEIAGAGVRAP